MHGGDQTGEGQGSRSRQGEGKRLGQLKLSDRPSGLTDDEQRNLFMIGLTLHNVSFLRPLAAAWYELSESNIAIERGSSDSSYYSMYSIPLANMTTVCLNKEGELRQDL